MKTTLFFLSALVLTIGGICLGMAIAYSPYGFPGTFGPPASQQTVVIPVVVSDDAPALKAASVYLIPFDGIRGNRAYSALILVFPPGKKVGTSEKKLFYLQTESLNLVQPINITPDDSNSDSNIIVKLIDEGPNAGQYYRNARKVTLSSSWTLKL